MITPNRLTACLLPVVGSALESWRTAQKEASFVEQLLLKWEKFANLHTYDFRVNASIPTVWNESLCNRGFHANSVGAMGKKAMVWPIPLDPDHR